MKGLQCVTVVVVVRSVVVVSPGVSSLDGEGTRHGESATGCSALPEALRL